MKSVLASVRISGGLYSFVVSWNARQKHIINARAGGRVDGLVLLRLLFGLFLLGLALPRRLAVIDEVAATLQIRVALEHVLVERRLLQYPAGVEQIGARVDRTAHDRGIA